MLQQIITTFSEHSDRPSRCIIPYIYCSATILYLDTGKTNRKPPHLKQAIHFICTNTILVPFQLSDSVASVLASRRSLKLPYGFFRNPHVPEQHFIVKTCLPYPLPLLQWDLPSRSYSSRKNYTTYVEIIKNSLSTLPARSLPIIQGLNFYSN